MKKASMISVETLFDELEKIAVAGLPARLSMAGLGGLTALEAHGAMDSSKPTKERVKSGLGAAATGTILAGEALANRAAKAAPKVMALAKR